MCTSTSWIISSLISHQCIVNYLMEKKHFWSFYITVVEKYVSSSIVGMWWNLRYFLLDIFCAWIRTWVLNIWIALAELILFHVGSPFLFRMDWIAKYIDILYIMIYVDSLRYDGIFSVCSAIATQGTDRARNTHPHALKLNKYRYVKWWWSCATSHTRSSSLEHGGPRLIGGIYMNHMKREKRINRKINKQNRTGRYYVMSRSLLLFVLVLLLLVLLWLLMS
jgi:hypothetical protein